MARKYELKQRAERQAETRERIVRATVELHAAVGPARTTISAIAERAGVQRLTVYRHFPDEHSLLLACAHQWSFENPPPDLSMWAAIDDPAERLRIALRDVYDFFRTTEGMTGNLLRDLPESPVLQEVAAPFARYWDDARTTLYRGWRARGPRRKLLRAALNHAIEFETWRSLAHHQGLDDAEAAEMMAGFALTAQIRAPGRRAEPRQGVADPRRG